MLDVCIKRVIYMEQRFAKNWWQGTDDLRCLARRRGLLGWQSDIAINGRIYSLTFETHAVCQKPSTFLVIGQTMRFAALNRAAYGALLLDLIRDMNLTIIS